MEKKVAEANVWQREKKAMPVVQVKRVVIVKMVEMLVQVVEMLVLVQVVREV